MLDETSLEEIEDLSFHLIESNNLYLTIIDIRVQSFDSSANGLFIINRISVEVENCKKCDGKQHHNKEGIFFVLILRAAKVSFQRLKTLYFIDSPLQD